MIGARLTYLVNSKETEMAQVTMALNGRIMESEGQSWENMTLEELAEEWKDWASKTKECEFYFSSGMQIVYRDKRYGSVLTAWVENPSDAVSFQVLEMG